MEVGICGWFRNPAFTSCWLVVEPTTLKNISQNGSFPQVRRNIYNKYLKPPPRLRLVVVIPLFTYRVLAPSQMVGLGISEPINSIKVTGKQGSSSRDVWWKWPRKMVITDPQGQHGTYLIAVYSKLAKHSMRGGVFTYISQSFQPSKCRYMNKTSSIECCFGRRSCANTLSNFVVLKVSVSGPSLDAY